MKWLISTFLLLFSTIIGPSVGLLPERLPDPPPDPAPIAAPEPQLPPDPVPIETPDPKPEPEPEPEPVRNTKLYVLMYHHFVQEGQDRNVWMFPDIRLREDLQWLADHGYTTVLPSELVEGKPLPEKAVMLTFDDGYDSNYTLAYPILREFQAKAVISIVVRNTDEQKPGALTWDMCQEMVQSGLVEIGSHTYDLHKGETGITRLKGESREDYKARVLPDLQTSIDLIEENLGKAPQVFAYPNGRKDSWAAGFIQDHFAITLTTQYGVSNISKGLYSLRRCNVSMEERLWDTLPD